MTKRIFILIWLCVSAISWTFAQEMTVKSMTVRPTDLTARSHVRNDLNGEPCALIRVEFPLNGVLFDGNLVGNVERHVNEYLVYLTAGSKSLEIRHPNFYTLEISFPDYNIPRVEGLQTYRLVVSAPQIVTTEDHDNPKPKREEKKASVIFPKVGIESGHEYVDLGLPSGTLWATCNIGASNPEDFGDYYSWGTVNPQLVYDWQNTPYQTQKTTSYLDTKWIKYLGSTTSKYKDEYATDSDALKTVLDPEDDAAHVNWGGNWRIPTKEEQDELRDSNNCVWTWTSQNGVNGYRVTSTINNNSIFLPASGCRLGSGLYYNGVQGYYCSSSLTTNSPHIAYCLYFYSGYTGWSSSSRDYGLSVRPVCVLPE